MYLNFYGLHKEPFNLTPDPEFFFLGEENQQALASLIYGIEKRKGCVAITGEVGVGKTTMVRSYLEESRDSGLKVIYVFNSNLSFQGLVKIIYQEMGLAVKSDNLSDLVNGLQLALIEAYQQGINVALIIDEAQNMPVETLENLRMLSNLETVKDKLIQIILVGQPELEEILDRKELRAFRQRIFIRLVIGPFSFEESEAYIKHRLMKAGGCETPIFTRKALHLIIKEAQGIPRIMNILCDNALITGFGYGKKPVGIKVALEIIKDFRGREVAKFKKPMFKLLPIYGKVVLGIIKDFRGREVVKFKKPMFKLLPVYGLVLAVLLLAGGLFFFRENLPGTLFVASTPASPALPAYFPTVPSPPTNPTVLKEQKVSALEHHFHQEKFQKREPKQRGSRAQQVEKGDTLTFLVRKRYGPEEIRQYGRSRLISLIQEKNPGLKDLDRIVAGKTIIFPKLNGKSGEGR